MATDEKNPKRMYNRDAVDVVSLEETVQDKARSREALESDLETQFKVKQEQQQRLQKRLGEFFSLAFKIKEKRDGRIPVDGNFSETSIQATSFEQANQLLETASAEYQQMYAAVAQLIERTQRTVQSVNIGKITSAEELLATQPIFVELDTLATQVEERTQELKQKEREIRSLESQAKKLFFAENGFRDSDDMFDHFEAERKRISDLGKTWLGLGKRINAAEIAKIEDSIERQRTLFHLVQYRNIEPLYVPLQAQPDAVANLMSDAINAARHSYSSELSKIIAEISTPDQSTIEISADEKQSIQRQLIDAAIKNEEAAQGTQLPSELTNLLYAAIETGLVPYDSQIPSMLRYKVEDILRWDEYVLQAINLPNKLRAHLQTDDRLFELRAAAPFLSYRGGDFPYRLDEANRQIYTKNPLLRPSTRMWSQLSDLPEVKELYGADVMDRMEVLLPRLLFEKMLTLSPRAEYAEHITRLLYEYPTTRYAPYAVLQAWREPGGGGAHPFLYGGNSSELARYVENLSDSDVEQIAQIHPAVGRIIENVRSHAESFAQSTIRRGGVYVDNPTYVEIQKDLISAANELLKSDNPHDQFFACGLLRNSREALSEGMIARMESVYAAGNPTLKKELFDSAVRYASQGASKEIFSFLASKLSNISESQLAGLGKAGVDAMSKYLKESLTFSKGAFFNAALYGDADLQHSIATILGTTPEQLSEAIRLYKAVFDRPDQYASLQDYHVEALLEAAPRTNEIVAAAESISSWYPKAKWYFFDFDSFDSSTPAEEHLCRVLISRDLHRVLEIVSAVSSGEVSMDADLRSVARLLQKEIRAHDPVLENSTELYTVENPEQFYDALGIVRTQVGDDQDLKEILRMDAAWRFIARQPERAGEIARLKEEVPSLFTFIAPGGPLHSNKEMVIRDIFGNGNALGRAREVCSVFSQPVPYWQQLYTYTELRLGDRLAGMSGKTGKYRVNEIAGVSIGQLIEEHALAVSQGRRSALAGMLANEQVLERVLAESPSELTIEQLSGMQKRLVFRDHIQQTVERTRDAELKRNADERNRLLARSDFSFQGTHFVHGTDARYMDAIFNAGNLCGESLGESSSADAFPFYFDCFRVSPEHVNTELQVRTLHDVMQKTTLDNYAVGAGSVVLLYDRNRPDIYESGKEVFAGVQGELHYGVLGGMPATEITGIALLHPETTLTSVAKSMMENGFYIPLYDMSGKLLFTPEQFDEMREYHNMNIQVPVWDFSMRVGEKMGSNDGGMYIVPSVNGPERHYVKFSREDEANLWNEHLTNKIYAALRIPVAETSVVRVGDSYGHASKMVTVDEISQFKTDLKHGFVADCLLGNWDIVFDRNSVTSGGQLVRIDNGGSLLYRARGGRRDWFGPIVTELESMRRAYPGLEDTDILEQVVQMRELLSDQRIDELVDSVRMTQEDRDAIRVALRQRRDYIIEVYSGEGTAPTEIPARGAHVVELLRQPSIDDTALSAEIPEWRVLMGEEGYQHNGVLLGEHLKEAVAAIHQLPEFVALDSREQHLATLAMLFHDFGKPTGRRGGSVERDYRHEIPSANMAARYMAQWGYSSTDIRAVVQIITYDGVVSDIARDKVRDERLRFTPTELLKEFQGDESRLRILRAVNKADVYATVGESMFTPIEEKYNQFFDSILNKASSTTVS